MNTSRRAHLAGLLGVAVCLTASSASARHASSSGLDTRPNVIVEASVGNVDIEVHTSSANRVEIVGTSLPAGFTAKVSGSTRRVEVEVEGIGVPGSGKLELSVPKDARLELDTRNGDVTVHDLRGEADISVVQGDIAVDGAPQHVEASTTSGDIRVVGVRVDAELSTVSGDVQVSGMHGRLEVGTVSGDITVSGSVLERSELAVVSGTIDVHADLRAGSHDFAAHSGDISVRVGAKQGARFRVETFSGTIEDALLDPPVATRGRHLREIGDGSARVDVATFSGSVRLGRAK
ncbi:MAG: DUF4097 family beta strand repeat-containing protein [Nannocystaceae bacterium]|nr:DUF4097 domain-containing protein [bacterium]